jgi:LPS sulfotransferase NodH
MFHIGRCGSTVLGQLLDQHPHIRWAGEFFSPIFTEWKNRNNGVETVGEMPGDAIDLLQRSIKRAQQPYYGFEIKPFHFRLIDYSPESFVQHLDSLGFMYFILLDRRNRLRKIVSSIIAHQSGNRYHITRDTKAQLTRIHINVDEVKIDYTSKSLLEFLSDYDKQMHALETLLQGRRSLYLTYEEDIQADPRIAYLRICDFLGVPPVNVSVKLSRTNPFPVRDMIGNIEEVEDALRGTPYEWMLDD